MPPTTASFPYRIALAIGVALILVLPFLQHTSPTERHISSSRTVLKAPILTSSDDNITASGSSTHGILARDNYPTITELSHLKCGMSDLTCVNNLRSDAAPCGPGKVSVGYESCQYAGDYFGTSECCPIIAAPTRCIWRGGEESIDPCMGQCHEGEIVMHTSKKGGFPNDKTTKECKNGVKVLCCTADRLQGLISQCHANTASGDCGPDFIEVASTSDNCHEPRFWQSCKQFPMCCPRAAKLSQCHWNGEGGGCNNNACAFGEIEVAKDSYGDNDDVCKPSPKKALCCTAPDELGFLPVDPVKIWPNIPPVDSNIGYELEFLTGQNPNDNPLDTPFGWIVISGPSSAVANLHTKRDGSKSDLVFLDCHNVRGESQQSVRLVCASNGPESDCDHIMEGGVAGTVVRMPRNCGAGTYAVAHSLDIAQDQTIPPALERLPNRTVLQLTFDYDFGLVKRDAGEVLFRIDMATIGGYYEDAVLADPVTKRDLDERFWTPKDDAWIVVFDKFLDRVRAKYWFPGTSLTREFDTTLVANKTDCGTNGTAFGAVRAKGTVWSKLRMAATLFGELGPEPQVDHATVFMSGQISTMMEINASISGKMFTDYKVAELFPEIYDQSFCHPGLFCITPTLSAEAGVQANIGMDGEFISTGQASTGDIISVWPRRFRNASGHAESTDLDSPPSVSGRFNNETFSGGFLQVDLIPSLGVHVELNSNVGLLGNGKYADYRLNSKFGVSQKLQVNSAGVWNLTQQAKDLHNEQKTLGAIDFNGWDRDDSTWLIQMLSDLTAIAGNDPTEQPSAQDDFNFDDFADETALASSTVEVTCGLEDKCPLDDFTCDVDMCALDPDLCDPEDDPNALVKRGGSRPFKAEFWDGRHVSFRSKAYPPPADLFKDDYWEQIYDRGFQVAVPADCSNLELEAAPLPRNSKGQPNGAGFSVEHVLELNTIAFFVEFATTGIYRYGKRPSGLTTKVLVAPQWFLTNWNNNTAMLPTSAPVWNNTDSKTIRNPSQRVMEAVGSNWNTRNLALLNQTHNGIKSSLWTFKNPREIGLYNKDVTSWLKCEKSASDFLVYLKAVVIVFKYLQHPQILHRYYDQMEMVREQLSYIESAFGLEAAGLSRLWDMFIRDHNKHVYIWGKQWMLERIDYTRRRIQDWEDAGKPLPPTVDRVKLLLIQFSAAAIRIPSNMPPPPYPPPEIGWDSE